MTVKIDGTNTTANPGITGSDADTGLQFGTDEVSIVTTGGTASTNPHVVLNLHNNNTGDFGSAIAFTSNRNSNETTATIGLNQGSTGLTNLVYNCTQAHIFKNNTTNLSRIDLDGLKFNGDTAQVNALDDYEEGTWTPTPYLSYNPSNRGIAASGESGRYTKIGQIVHVWFEFNYSINGSGGFNLGISNLPFTVKNNASFTYNGGGTAREAAHTGYMFFAEGAVANTTQLTVLRRYDNGSPRDPSGTMVGHVTYEAA